MLRHLRNLRAANRSLTMTDVPDWQRRIVELVRPYTMAGDLRTLSTISAVEYIEKNDVIGTIVECGVWRGGQMMAAALTLMHLGASRELYLFDTFTGMTQPGHEDRDHENIHAEREFKRSQNLSAGNRWCEASIDVVRKNIRSTGYPENLVHFVAGDVMDTLPGHAPPSIAYLRLDTDWYASTRHEFEHLYPRVAYLGIITIDDYGHWQGARKAADEFLCQRNLRVFLHRIDYSARQFVKV
jgi:O-methyltransferase